jgi:hypothetical protein
LRRACLDQLEAPLDDGDLLRLLELSLHLLQRAAALRAASLGFGEGMEALDDG